MENIVKSLIQFAIAVAILSLVWWGLTHPVTAAGVLVTAVDGVTTFVTTIINGVASVL